MKKLLCRLDGHRKRATLTFGNQSTGGGRLERCTRCSTTLNAEIWDPPGGYREWPQIMLTEEEMIAFVEEMFNE